MTKQKIAIVAGVPLLSLVLLGGGFALGKGVFTDKKVANLQSASASQGGPSNNTIPLGQDSEPEQTPSGLSVSSSGAMDMGQLGASGSGGAQGTSTGSGSGGGASAGSSAPNPSTFKDYEKYKDQTHALFGEITKGTGAELTMNKKAAIYYKGWLTNGQLFDQSRTNSSGQKQPLIFTLGAREVVPGMEEGVLGMKVGGKRLVLVPPAVGYGAQGQGSVPPNSLMIFEVELVTVQ